MGFCLPSHISFCRSSDRTILLDLRRDTYFQLDPSLEATFLTLQAGVKQVPDPGELQQLLDLGIIQSHADVADGFAPAALATPGRSCVDDPTGPPGSLFFTAEIWWSVRKAQAAVRKIPFERLIDRLRVRKAAQDVGGGQVGLERMLTLARRFIGARRGAPIDPICLQDSLALLEIFARRGFYPDFVIGVTAAPFMAHCWVQAGSVVLNETLDEVLTFEPILVV